MSTGPGTGPDGHHTCLGAALTAWREQAPAAAARARATLPRALTGLRSSAHPEIAWRFSRLTADRFPVELSLVSCDSAVVRYTVEVAGPETLEHERLEAAVRTGSAIVGPAAPEVVRTLAAVQDGAVLRWGAWLGVRHTSSSDAWKVYAEVPPGAEPAFRDDWWRPVTPSRLRMIGYDVTGDAVETYYRLARCAETDIGVELAAAGHSEHVDEVTELLRELAGDPVRSRVPPATYGISVRHPLSHRDEPEVVTLYTSARSLIGPESRIRDRLGRVCSTARYAIPTYSAFARTGRGGRHGMVGLTLVRGQVPRLVVGMSAPHHEPATSGCGRIVHGGPGF